MSQLSNLICLMLDESGLYQCFLHRYIFTIVDKDGDKLISKGEYAAFIKSSGLEQSVAEAELDEEMGKFDEDGDGAWNQQEFLRAINVESDDEEMLEFQAWDKDGDGSLSGEEIKDVFVNIGAVEFAALADELIMKGLDLNGDGEIRLLEFFSNIQIQSILNKALQILHKLTHIFL